MALARVASLLRCFASISNG